MFEMLANLIELECVVCDSVHPQLNPLLAQLSNVNLHLEKNP